MSQTLAENVARSLWSDVAALGSRTDGWSRACTTVILPGAVGWEGPPSVFWVSRIPAPTRALGHAPVTSLRSFLPSARTLVDLAGLTSFVLETGQAVNSFTLRIERLAVDDAASLHLAEVGVTGRVVDTHSIEFAKLALYYPIPKQVSYFRYIPQRTQR